MRNGSGRTMEGFFRSTLLALCTTVAIAPVEAAVEVPIGVEIRTLGHGVQLTDARGLTLYTYDIDLKDPGTSACTGACADMRPPLLADTVPADFPSGWSTIPRDDGSQQWAYGGRPLYRYARDLDPGAIFGVGEGWNLALIPLTTPAEMSVTDTVKGHVLATASGKTLYARTGDDVGAKACDRVCEKTWIPLRAAWASRDFAAFSVMKRSDGIYQWAVNGEPLYSFAGDARPGDLNGDGYDGLWRPVILEPAPPVPDWVTVVKSDGGALYANADGMTLYRQMLDQNWSAQAIRSGNHCNETCLESYWVPLTAESHLPRVGNWSVIETEENGLQWAYQGMPLYTLNLETRPGQLFYTTFREFQWMKPIMYALPALQGVF